MIALMSEAGEYIDQILRELEDTKVISDDGASAELLEHLLTYFSQEIKFRSTDASSFLLNYRLL